MSRRVLHIEELTETLLEIKRRVADLESIVKKTYNDGIYRISFPPYDIIILDHSNE